ncbi:MAG: hypothetical protein IJM23_04605 [Lachnospiraceae bacterium]|nr:hypothetical protein [Lachnospiraceae bacterium]
MSDSVKTINCKNCGAPVTSEICPFCGSMTGLDTLTADMEYPVLECKEANIGFWTVAFPAVFAIGFGYAGLVMPVMMFITKDQLDIPGTFAGFSVLFFLPFALVGIVATVFTVIPIYRYLMLKIKGKEIYGTVYGYCDDKVMLNNRPAQVVKILVQSPEGPRFIMYQMGTTDHPYGINTKIGLRVYKDMFMIEKKKTSMEW